MCKILEGHHVLFSEMILLYTDWVVMTRNYVTEISSALKSTPGLFSFGVFVF